MRVDVLVWDGDTLVGQCYSEQHVKRPGNVLTVMMPSIVTDREGNTFYSKPLPSKDLGTCQCGAFSHTKNRYCINWKSQFDERVEKLREILTISQ
jgi:hypothetical protein